MPTHPCGEATRREPEQQPATDRGTTAEPPPNEPTLLVRLERVGAWLESASQAIAVATAADCATASSMLMELARATADMAAQLAPGTAWAAADPRAALGTVDGLLVALVPTVEGEAARVLAEARTRLRTAIAVLVAQS